MKLTVIAAAAFLGLGAAACTPDQFTQGASILLSAGQAGAAPLCSAIAKGKAAPTNLCVSGAGILMSILDYAAQNGIRAHIAGGRLYYDGRIAGFTGPRV